MLSTFGSTWLATPSCDRLAAAGLVLDNVQADTDDLQEILRGVIGPAAGLPRQRDGDAHERLLVTDSPAVAEAGWSSLVDRVVLVPATPTSSCREEEPATNPGRLIAAAIAAVAEAAGACRWLWVHLESLGVAWDAPLDFRDSLASEDDPLPTRSAAVPARRLAAGDDPDEILGVRQAFAGQVMLVDRLLGRLAEAVASSRAASADEGDEGDAWSVAVVGMRGMPLGLHGEVGLAGEPPATLPYGDRMQMPVVIGPLGGTLAGQRFGGLLAAADLGDLLADLITVPGAQPVCASLAGLMSGKPSSRRERVISRTARGRSLVTSEWRLVMAHQAAVRNAVVSGDGSVQLFSKPDDFFEQCDVADRCPQVVEQLLAAFSSAEHPAEGDRGG